MSPEEYKQQVLEHDFVGLKWLYPVTIVSARYAGVYENGSWVALLCHENEIPEEVTGDDIACYEFFSECSKYVGIGGTPNDALTDLEEKWRSTRTAVSR